MGKIRVLISLIVLTLGLFSYPGIPGAFELPESLLDVLHERSEKQSNLEVKISDALGNIGKNVLLENVRGVKEIVAFQSVAPSVVCILSDDIMGSGAIISREGLLISNWHVVNNSKKAVVVFKPKDSAELKRELAFRATVIRIDPVRDLALLKIDSPPKDISFMDLADPSSISIGQDVHAIGHPEGEIWTYTKGFISQIRPGYEWKTRDGVVHRAKIIQTQTPVNPGSSGGPLFNDQGQLIGINSFVRTGTEGLNYAVAVDEIKAFLSEKIVHDTVPPQVSGKIRCSEAYDSTGEGWNNILGCYFAGRKPPPDFWSVLPSADGPALYVLFDSHKDGLIDTLITSEENEWLKMAYFMDKDCDGIIDLIGLQNSGEHDISSYKKPPKRITLLELAGEFADAIRQKKIPYPGLKLLPLIVIVHPDSAV